MARYRIYEPTYVGGIHLGIGATPAFPREVELPDEVIPSLKWDALDEAALKAFERAITARAQGLTDGLDPGKDKDKITKVFEDTRKKFKKTILRPPEQKVVPKEIDTNVEIAEQGRRVVGRASDRSPV